MQLEIEMGREGRRETDLLIERERERVKNGKRRRDTQMEHRERKYSSVFISNLRLYKQSIKEIVPPKMKCIQCLGEPKCHKSAKTCLMSEILLFILFHWGYNTNVANN